MVIEQHRIADRVSWLAGREKDVTASVAGCLLGVHPYQTAFGLWALKSGRIQADPEETPEIRRGRLFEDDALQVLAEDRPSWTVTPANDVYFRDPLARIGATPDAYAVDPTRRGRGIIQVKTTSDLAFKRGWLDEEGEVELPLWIAVQAIVEAKLTGAAWAAVALLVVGSGLDLRVLDVPIHDGVYARLKDEVAAFWTMVASGTEPDPDFGRDAANIGRLYPDDRGTEIDLSRDNRLPTLLAKRRRRLAYVKAAKAWIGRADAEVKSKLGPHARGHVPGFRITWASQPRAGHFVPPSEARVLRINPSK